MRTKESQNKMIYSTESLWGEANPRTSESKEAYQLSDERKGDTFRPFLRLEGEDAVSWTPFLSNFSVVSDRRELSHKPSIQGNKNVMLVAGDFPNKCRDSSKTKPVFQMDAKSYSDKRVVESETLDSVDHHKGMSEHVLKDICVDEVENPVNKFSVSSKNDLNMARHGSTEGGSNVKHSTPYQSATLSFEGSVAAAAERPAQESSKYQLRNSFGQDPPKFHSSVDLVQKDEPSSEPVTKNVPDALENETPRLFRSFLSLDDDETKAAPSSKKIPFGIPASEDSKTAPAASGMEEDELEDSSPDLSPSKRHGSGPEQSPSKKDVPSSDSGSQLPGIKNTDGQAPALSILKHENKNSYNDSIGKYDVGESSFSEAHLITYSKPNPHSGSISMHSDGSISSRSFAFPILQSEWNSSPVKMAKPDRRHFRKHRGWRSGVFCCRF